MRQGRVAQRYAEALLRAAIDDKTEEVVTSDLRTLNGLIESSKDLQLLLKSPVIKHEKKRQILKAIFDGSVCGTSMGFLDLLAEKGRESALPFIIDRFFELRNERLGIVRLDVTSGASLSAEQQKTLQDRFAEMMQKTISMEVRVDKTLKGGFLARIGDTVFDGTIKRQLELIRRRFLEGNVTN